MHVHLAQSCGLIHLHYIVPLRDTCVQIMKQPVVILYGLEPRLSGYENCQVTTLTFIAGPDGNAS